MRPAARHLAALAWLAALALLAALAVRELSIGTDLRLFLPAPRTAAERLLVEEIGEGPAARLLLVAISGGDAPQRVAASRALAEALRGDALFRRVANGEDADGVDEALLPYRYLLTPSFDARPLDAELLGEALAARLEDLESPIGPAIEQWLPRDPTLELASLAERMRGSVEIALDDDVFVSRDGTRALLAIETAAAGFDPDAQALALARLEQAFARAAPGDALALQVSGPGRFATTIKQRTQADAKRLSLLATLGMVLITLFAYRSTSAIVLAALPLASAAVAGLAAVAWIFGEVHGITLAFGATLIGVAQDYPVHLLSHQRPGLAPRDNARALWPTLATGVASTCIAYGAFLASGVSGLAQLGVFTIAGLAAAALSTRWLVPPLLDPALRDRAASAPLARVESALDAVRVARVGIVTAVLAALAAIAIAFAPGPVWQNDLAALTPLPPQLLREDAALRAELGAPDARHLVVLEGADAEGVLARVEALEPALAELAAQGAIAGYDHAARYLPSIAT
ncbi:MAG TPA: MMPL family transporter, partial [Xanthomonadales bacterium]|nr:MMPL family transporter [Xanthomonadales bacterium]